MQCQRFAVADTGIPGKQDYSKFQSWLMWTGFKGYGQSPENGAKPLIYACCAPEEDLRGVLLHVSPSDSV